MFEDEFSAGKGGNKFLPTVEEEPGPGVGVMVVPEGKFMIGASAIPVGILKGVGEDDLGVFCFDIFLKMFNLLRSGSLDNFSSLPSLVSGGIMGVAVRLSTGVTGLVSPVFTGDFKDLLIIFSIICIGGSGGGGCWPGEGIFDVKPCFIGDIEITSFCSINFGFSSSKFTLNGVSVLTSVMDLRGCVCGRDNGSVGGGGCGCGCDTGVGGVNSGTKGGGSVDA